MFETMKQAAQTLGKPEWRGLLSFCAGLHERCVNPAEGVFPYAWEEIGTGYFLRPAFGHWDIAHIIMDEAEYEPEHARRQILNDLANQEPDGLLPGSIWKRGGGFTWSKTCAHAPLWIYAADEVYARIREPEFLKTCLTALRKQLGWFERCRRADNGGYFYNDILCRDWESGIDEGVRFLRDDLMGKRLACVDATAHVFGMLERCVCWSELLGEPAVEETEKLERTREELSTLYDPQLGWFFDSWDIRRPERRIEAFEGMFPMVCGAAAAGQAQGVRDALMDPEKFYSPHPIATVALDSPHFEKRMWRGPAWNSMTMWAVFGLLRYGFREDAARMAGRALDSSAKVFAETGEIWEFYDSLGGDPGKLARKPASRQNAPCTDYLGHAPLFWLARVYDSVFGADI